MAMETSALACPEVRMRPQGRTAEPKRRVSVRATFAERARDAIVGKNDED